jgi:hypothetical protein
MQARACALVGRGSALHRGCFPVQRHHLGLLLPAMHCLVGSRPVKRLQRRPAVRVGRGCGAAPGGQLGTGLHLLRNPSWDSY